MAATLASIPALCLRVPALLAGCMVVMTASITSAVAGVAAGEPASSSILIAQLIALLVVGRLLGEVAQRCGQPAVVGQLLAGIALGPSVFGALWHDGQQWLFPASLAQHGMLDAIAQLGVLMLLLLTGMETNLSVVKRVRRPASWVSVFGMVIPFAGGLALGFLLPDSLLPAPKARLLTALFLGTALSISSLKIVASVIRELNFTHRLVGEVLLAAAVLDDTLGWIILSAVFGLARHGQVDLARLGQTLLGTLIFLLASFTLGRRMVTILIRWSNDHLRSEMAVVTTILVVMMAFALGTDALGLHTVLGAFVAGVLVGQSPILTMHIDQQLRGLIMALFMPVFFGLAGLSANLGALADPHLLGWAVAFIVVASIGKFGGALLGGKIGGLTLREALAIGCGMNARGSTEIIIATLGLAMGALTPALFTLIVTMAVVTTLIMPSTLRFALHRLPMNDDDRERLQIRDFEATSYVAHLERLLMAVDDSPSSRLAARLVGLLAGSRGMPITVLPLTREAGVPAEGPAPAENVASAAGEALEATGGGGKSALSAIPVLVAKAAEPAQATEAIAVEARKGFDLLWVGIEPVLDALGSIHAEVARAANGFGGRFAVVAGMGEAAVLANEGPLRVLLAVTGTAYSRRAAEVALALAQASGGSVTALYVSSADASNRGLRGNYRLRGARGPEAAVLREVTDLGAYYKVPVDGRVSREAEAADAILALLRTGSFSLLVMGVTARADDAIYFGPVPAKVLASANKSVLLVAT